MQTSYPPAPTWLPDLVTDVARLKRTIPDTVLRPADMTERLEVSSARRIVAMVLRSHGVSFPRIGFALGVDHTTVIQTIKGWATDADRDAADQLSLKYAGRAAA